MPIQLTPITHKDLMHGYTWQVSDAQLLAEAIAGVALGQSRQVRRILSAVGAPLSLPNNDVRTTAIDMLSVPSGADSWHRDGWIFQVMSWLAACVANPNSLINTPHMIHAQKGFDGLQLDFDDKADEVTAVVIFEDKATENPRTTIREEVWPEFDLLEKGDRANVLVAEVLGLLEKRPSIDVDGAIRKVIWKDVRRFRVSITVADSHSTSAGRGRLFKNYDEKVAGAIERRRGETFYVSDLRTWMSNIANMAISHLATMKPSHV
jgi:hypothetical protein